jgi:hypothetical protein
VMSPAAVGAPRAGARGETDAGHVVEPVRRATIGIAPVASAP